MNTIGLPKNEKTFSIDVEGELSKTRYRGDFVCVCVPTLRQQSDIAILEARLNGDLATLDPDTKALNRMIANCTYRVISAPEWWMKSDGGRDLMDKTVMIQVFTECFKAQTGWLENVWGQDEKEKAKVEEKPADVQK